MSAHDVIARYVDVWNERDADARLALMKSALTEDALYIDPENAGLRGHVELSEEIGRAQQRFGDLEFTLEAVLGVHHDQALFVWRLGTVVTGYDAVEFAGDRIRRVVGFFT